MLLSNPTRCLRCSGSIGRRLGSFLSSTIIKHRHCDRNLATTTYKMADKKLFTPGPLGTSPTVKQAMLRDLGSRDVEFINLVKHIRSKLIDIAGVPHAEYTAVPIQGSGTFAVESVFQTAVPRSGGKVICIENGAYGKRLGKICDVMGLDYEVLSFPENSYVSPEKVADLVKWDSPISLIAMVHCETSSGVINPAVEVGQLVKKASPNCNFMVDAMSSFGAVPLDLEAGQVDWLVSSVNKCLEGVPGFSYVIAKLDKLMQCKGNSRSLTLDAYDQYDNLEKTNQFRFTPPTHTMLAFSQALAEFDQEGGLQARTARYAENCSILKAGMKEMGFQEFLDPVHHGYIITSFCFPQHKNFDFQTFYMKLNDRDQVIYPGKVLNADCFRIGSIGYLFPEDVRHLLVCIKEVCAEMDIQLPIQEDV